ncbi:MAG: Zn-ribbon domain-containing OB-fold protein [Deltaproteobacteria bacterium]|jgi:uncharacterized OB-fold protein
MVDKKPLPVPNADTKPFWDGCREHELRFQRCWECGHVRWPPSTFCPKCHSGAHDMITASGKGRVFTFAVYHQAHHPAFRDEVPYVVAVVELEEGVRLLSNIVGCRHDEVRCEMPVEVTWEDLSEEFSLPQFKPRSL